MYAYLQLKTPKNARIIEKKIVSLLIARPPWSSESLDFNKYFLQGTCYTASECGTKSGTSDGNCAAGFGVCCTFT